MAIAILCLGAAEANADQVHRNGSGTSRRDCTILPGDYVGQGCKFKTVGVRLLRIRSVNARAQAVYPFRIPATATIWRIQIDWYEPSDVYNCYGEGRKVERSGRHLTIRATSGRPGHISLCGIDAVHVYYN